MIGPEGVSAVGSVGCEAGRLLCDVGRLHGTGGGGLVRLRRRQGLAGGSARQFGDLVGGGRGGRSRRGRGLRERLVARRLNALVGGRRVAGDGGTVRVNLGDINDAEDVTRLAGLDQEAQVIGAMRANRTGAENVGRSGAAIIIAGILGRAGVLNLEA